MTRHGKNNTASPCYSYYERQRDAKNSGYGTQRQRMNKDSVKDFDACSLTLQPCKQPVITREGILFDKEAVLEYIIQKKQDALRRLRQYEKQTQREKREMKELAEAEERSRTEKFLKLERGITNPASTSTALVMATNCDGTGGGLNRGSSSKTSVEPWSGTCGGQSKKAAENVISNIAGDLGRKLPSFWIPSLTPQSKETKMKRPSTEVLCPITGKPLKAKDLIPITFTPVDSSASVSSTQKDRYMCPVTHDVLSNCVQCAVLLTSGNVVTMECIEKIIKKDMLDPLNGKVLKTDDIIPLQRGGTGYAHTNELVAEIKKPVMQV